MSAAPDRRAAVFIDESWFVLWPYPASSWAPVRRPQRIAEAKSWRKTERPPSCVLYGSMDGYTREVQSEWHGTWNQEETWLHLQNVVAAYERRGVSYLVVFWDHAPWHLAASVQSQVAAHNRGAKQNGGVHILLFVLPVKSPWLMPLESVFGQTKRAVGLAQRAALAELQSAVDQRLQRRNAAVRKQSKHYSPISLV